MFKCLIFVHWLSVPEDGEIRTRILSKLEQNSKIIMRIVAEEYKRIENLRYDTARIEERHISKINTIKQKQHKETIARKIKPCYGCGRVHYYKKCLFRRKECLNKGPKWSQAYALQKTIK